MANKLQNISHITIERKLRRVINTAKIIDLKQ